MKRHQIKMLQTEVGLDKRKEVGLAGLFFWHQLVHYYSALMAHFSTGVDRILGEYVARIYDEVKARPIWTTMELVGFRDETGHPTDSVYCLKSRPESLNPDTLESLRQTQSRDPSGNRR